MKKLLPDLIAILSFVLLSFAYFFPADIENRILFQHDTAAGAGAGQEVKEYYEQTGERSRWTNLLFGGMPMYQIAPSYDSTKSLQWVQKAYQLFLPDYVCLTFMLMLGFYIRGCAFYGNGFKAITNNIHPIESPDDLKGLKIRTMEAPLIMSTYSAWGANPVPVDFSELYSSLQQNVVDGQENPYLTISDMRFYEVQKYMTISKHAYLSYVLTFSDAFLNGLPEDLEQVVMDCGKECVQYHRDQMAELNQGYYDNIAASGIAINTLTDEQREAFKDASASVYDEYRDKIGGDLLDAVVAACAK